MPDAKRGTDAVPVERAELITQDMELLADLIRKLYVEHAATFRCADPARVDGEVRSVTADGLGAGRLGGGGFEYTAHLSPADAPVAVVVTRGSGVITTAREELRFAAGDVLMVPAGLPSASTGQDAGFAALKLPWTVAGALAEESAGVAAADLRFEAMAPVSAARAAMFAGTVAFICGQLVDSGATEISALIAQELLRLAAAAMLETFPSTTMTAGYLRGPGWVPPAAVRRAAAFIDAHAARPVTLPEIAAAAGVSARALQYAFPRHYGTTPTGYLRRVRLDRAHAELRDSEPGEGLTVAAVARTWGWANPAQFTAAYRRQFGRLPSQTLRT